MDATYGAHYRDLYARHWWWRARERSLLGLLNELEPAQGWRRILDIGCGDGLLFDQLAPALVEGIEPSPEVVSPSGPYSNRIHLRPFDHTFQPADKYSLILMLDVLEHLDEPGDALAHARTLLTPGGRLVITVPAFMVLWTTHDVLNHHRIRYRRATILPLIQKAGLTVVRSEYWFQWLFVAKLMARLLERVTGAQPTPPTVPTHIVNDALLKLCLAEHRALHPLRLPFGSSLLVICQA